MLAISCLIGLLLSLALYAVALSALAAQRRVARGVCASDFTPPVSIIKPLCGLDDDLEENLESFFRLDYPQYEIIFSFARQEDPAFSVARGVADRHPEFSSVCVVDAREPGGNAKVNRLVAGLRHARFRFFLFSDGNVRVRSDFLRRAISWFRDPSVGLVSHLFGAAGARTLASRIESLHLNGPLRVGTAAIARFLGLPCVVGKSILVSRAALNTIGGFAPLRDFLAEDFLIGQRMRRAGYRVVLSGDEIATAEVSRSLRGVWDRHRRWAMLRRRLGGPSYAFEILAGPFPWFAAAVASSHGSVPVLAAAASLLLGRYASELASPQPVGHRLSFGDWILLPARDLFAAGVFFAGLFGRYTRWRGRRIRVGRGTIIEKPAPLFTFAARRFARLNSAIY